MLRLADAKIDAVHWRLVGDRGLVPCHVRIGREHLDSMFAFRSVMRGHAEDAQGVDADDLAFSGYLSFAIDCYSFWKVAHLKQVAALHGLSTTARPSRAKITKQLRDHICSSAECDNVKYIFKMLQIPRVSVSQTVTLTPPASELVACPHRGHASQTVDPVREEVLHDRTDANRIDDAVPRENIADGIRDTPLAGSLPAVGDTSFLEVASRELRHAIVREWEQAMSMAALSESVCAACGRSVRTQAITLVRPGKVDFSLLRNEYLPEHILPTTYSRTSYDGAILHPKGLQRRDVRGPLWLCDSCRKDLVDRRRMPRFALANWLYYGHDRLPASVREAFAKSTQVERMLVSRARMSKISFRFSETPGHYLYGTTPQTSQRYMKGNIAIHPQDVTHLNDFLPPSNDVIRDTLCAVFVGKSEPTRDNIEKLSPVLVRKSRVKTLVTFLTENNEHYAPEGRFRGFSQANLDELFGPGTVGQDAGVPCAMEIGRLEPNVATSAATENYVPGVDGPEDHSELLMENVGYIDNDDAMISHREMKMAAVSHCLRGGQFILSQAGSRFVPEFENPSLLTWLFPHLDPWGVGGFFDPRREHKLSLEQHLKYLLSVDGSPFRDDPDFAFVFYNIMQKRSVFESAAFRVNASQRDRVVRELLAVDVHILDSLAKKFEIDRHYKPEDPKERRLMGLLARVNAISHDLPGSNGYKIVLRNQVRALMNELGTPTLFITLNPSDRDHPLVRLYAGHEIDVNDEVRGEDLSSWERRVLAAKNPSACAKFFHKMITMFVEIILRYGRPGRGLFGVCKGYYGTVEAQGRGSLHCHMLVWLDKHPSPQKLRDSMMSNDEYRDCMFRWLESVIKCELPGTTDVISETPGHPLPPPARSAESRNPHPGTIPAPSISSFASKEEFETAFDAFVTELVKEYNWHEHKPTCFKYAPKGAVPADNMRKDALCRMRMDGVTRPTTCLDDETGGILLRRLHPRIVSYNDLVIFLMKSNMDVKFIGSGEAAKSVLYYITDYITKADLPAHVGLGALSYAIKKTNERFPSMTEDIGERVNRSALTTTVNRMVSRQEMSHQQIMSYLVGGGDVYTSHSYRVLHWASFDRLFKRYFDETLIANDHDNHFVEESDERDADHDLPVEEQDYGPASERCGVEELPPHDQEETFTLTMHPGSISATNQQQDYVYRSNDEPFDSLCLYEFVGRVDKERKGRAERASYGRDGPMLSVGHSLPGPPMAELGTLPRRCGRRQFARGEFNSDKHTI